MAPGKMQFTFWQMLLHRTHKKTNVDRPPYNILPDKSYKYNIVKKLFKGVIK
jgi:hypothetical protein